MHISSFFLNIIISFNSGETQKIIFVILFTHSLKNDKVDEVREDETGEDKWEVDEVEINHFHWLLNSFRIVCYLSNICNKITS